VVGIIGAMEDEMMLFQSRLENASTSTHAKMAFLSGTLNGQEIVLLKSGIGKVNAAVGTQIMIDRFPVSEILFTGLAGSLVPHLARGDVVVSNFVVQYDFDLTAFGRRHGELPDVGRMIEADPRLVKLVCYAFDNVFPKSNGTPRLVVGTVASGDGFVADPRKVDWLQREFGAVATEMEGAAVGYTCHLNDIPFVVLRTISDSGDSSAKDQFEAYLRKASENSFSIVSNVLELRTYRDRAASSGHSRAELFC
jgi:adenosylhomocysteine nucleosidase